MLVQRVGGLLGTVLAGLADDGLGTDPEAAGDLCHQLIACQDQEDGPGPRLRWVPRRTAFKGLPPASLRLTVRCPPQRGKTNATALLAEAERTLRSASAVAVDDPDAAYSLVYDAARFRGTALLAERGLRRSATGGLRRPHDRACLAWPQRLIEDSRERDRTVERGVATESAHSD
ncbi:hypothetical protein GCM10027215_33000 [Nocardioides zeae]